VIEEIRLYTNKFIIYYALIVHIIWGIVIIFNPDPIRTTTLNDLYSYIPNSYLLAATLIGFSLLTLWGIHGSVNLGRKRVFFLIPQQLLILASALTAFNAITSGQFADGVVRPNLFIFVDQLPALVIAVLYTIAIFDPFYDPRNTNSLTSRVGKLEKRVDKFNG
jgi:uncharacterized membrane protein